MLFRRKKRRQGRRSTPTARRQFAYGFAVLFILGITGYATWYVSRLPAVTISEIYIAGGETISHADVRSVVEKELRGSYMLLIPYQFTFLYPHDRILEQVSAIPRVHSVVVDRTDKNTLQVTFDEYMPYALWCDAAEDTHCFFIASDGYVFDEAPPLRGGAFIRYITETDIQPSIGAQLPQHAVQQTAVFARELQTRFGLRVTQVRITKNNDYFYELGSGGKLFTAADMRLEDTFANLKSILETPKFKHLTSGNFNYIDLRFGNKVYVNEHIDTLEIDQSEEVTEE